MVADDAFKWDNVVERFKELENLHFDGDGDEFVKPRDGAHRFGGRLDITLLSRRQWPGSMDRLLRAACDFGWPLNPDQNSGDGVGIGMSSTTTYNGRRTTSAAWLKNPPSTLTIYTNTRAIKILMESSNPGQKARAVGVLLADGRQVRASREVILSLGAVDTPRLLLLSGIGPQADLKELGLDCIVNQPQIGKNLMDHNWALLEWGVNTRFGDPVRHDLDPKQVSAAREEWLQHHTGPDATRTQAALVGFLKLDPQRHNLDELEKLDSQTSAWLKRPDVPHFEVFLEGIFLHQWDDLYGKEPLSMGVMLMNPQSRGSVTLASKDPSADPVIDVNFLSHPYDRQTLINGVREALAFMRSPSMAPYVTKEVLVPESDSDADVLAFCRKDLKSVFHPMGTVRMGPRNDASACVDPNFRLVGVDGLRVVDLSVCPVIPK
jgi:choline dehydrogenase-like flavoprotein